MRRLILYDGDRRSQSSQSGPRRIAALTKLFPSDFDCHDDTMISGRAFRNSRTRLFDLGRAGAIGRADDERVIPWPFRFPVVIPERPGERRVCITNLRLLPVLL